MEAKILGRFPEEDPSIREIYELGRDQAVFLQLGDQRSFVSKKDPLFSKRTLGASVNPNKRIFQQQKNSKHPTFQYIIRYKLLALHDIHDEQKSLRAQVRLLSARICR